MRLENLPYDLYVVTLRDEDSIKGCFAIESINDYNENNLWKFIFKSNPMNKKYEGLESIILNGEDIIAIRRL